MTYYHDPAQSSAAWDIWRNYMLFSFLIVVLLAGAFGVLVILAFMSHVPYYCVAALIVYIIIAISITMVAINRG